MSSRPTTAFALGLLLVCPACSGASGKPMPGDPLRGNGAVRRNVLSRGELLSAAAPSGPADDGAFALPAGAAPPRERFEGRLTLQDPATAGGARVLRNLFDYDVSPASPRTHLPPFSVEFVQNGSHLIPARQGLVLTGSPAWNYIAGPGRVWREDGDGEYTRAAFPFALVERNQNCVHNGSMTFLFSRHAQPNISGVRYQVTQETCLYFKLDLWGQARAVWTPGPVANAGAIADAAAREAATRLPTKPLFELPKDFPTSPVDLAAFTRAFRSPADITTFGVAVHGVNYVSDCQTRYGRYAFCSQMRLPSYSLAKSMFAGVALMWLGRRYGTAVYDELIRDYLPETASAGDWSGVTFAHAADMATGHYLREEREADEGSREESAFFEAESLPGKLQAALKPFPRRSAPGTRWIYQSHTTFLLTRAMSVWLQRHGGGDLFDAIRDEILVPLGVSLGGRTTLRTGNSASGQPFGAYGLFLTQDDAARIGQWLNLGEGVIQGKQVLDPARLRASLFRTADPARVGLPVSESPAPAVPGTFRYHNQFWAKRMTPAEFPQYRCDFWIPFLTGYGGNSVLLLPNGATFWLFSDGNEFVWYAAAHELGKIEPYCR